MSLPYSYKKHIDCDILQSKFFIKLEKNERVKNITSKNNIIEFEFLSELFGFKNKVIVDFETDKNGFYFEFFLHNLIKFSIIIIVVLGFLIRDFQTLLIFSISMIAIIYIFVIYYLSTTLTDIFEKIINDKTLPEEISEEQQKWIENPDICPACGTELTEFDNFCPECKLNLSNRRRAKKQPASRTGYFDYRINY